MNKVIKYTLLSILALAMVSLFYKKVYLPKITYQTTTPLRGEMEKRVYGVGEIGVKQIYSITPTIGAKVKSIFTDEGKWIKKRQKIAILDPIDLPKKLSQAKIATQVAILEKKALQKELQSLVAKKILAAKTFKRYKILYKKGFAAQAEFDKAKSDLDSIVANIQATKKRIASAKAKIKEIGKNYEALQERVAKYTILSPISGYVIEKVANVGQSLLANQPIIKVVDPKEVWIRTYVDERISADIKVGQKATITLRSHPDKIYKGFVKRIEPTSDAVTLEKRVDVAFDKLPIPFFMNEQADVKIFTKKLNNVLLLPSKAISYQNGSYGIWSVKEKRAHFLKVKILAREDQKVAIEGVDEKVRILIPSREKRRLHEGMRVEFSN